MLLLRKGVLSSWSKSTTTQRNLCVPLTTAQNSFSLQHHNTISALRTTRTFTSYTNLNTFNNTSFNSFNRSHVSGMCVGESSRRSLEEMVTGRRWFAKKKDVQVETDTGPKIEAKYPLPPHRPRVKSSKKMNSKKKKKRLVDLTRMRKDWPPFYRPTSVEEVPQWFRDMAEAFNKKTLVRPLEDLDPIHDEKLFTRRVRRTKIKMENEKKRKFLTENQDSDTPLKFVDRDRLDRDLKRKRNKEKNKLMRDDLTSQFLDPIFLK